MFNVTEKLKEIRTKRITGFVNMETTDNFIQSVQCLETQTIGVWVVSGNYEDGDLSCVL